MVQCGESLHEHVVEAGEMLVADRSAVLHMRLGGAVGFVLYDRDRCRAAAGLVSLASPGGGHERLPLRVNQCAALLLHRLVAEGSEPERIEIFALGPGLQSGRFSVNSEFGEGAPARVLLAYEPSGRGPARNAVFEVASGRMVLEGVPGD